MKVDVMKQMQKQKTKKHSKVSNIFLFNNNSISYHPSYVRQGITRILAFKQFLQEGNQSSSPALLFHSSFLLAGTRIDKKYGGIGAAVKNAWDASVTPGQGTKIPHALEQLRLMLQLPSLCTTTRESWPATKDPAWCNEHSRIQINKIKKKNVWWESRIKWHTRKLWCHHAHGIHLATDWAVLQTTDVLWWAVFSVTSLSLCAKCLLKAWRKQLFFFVLLTLVSQCYLFLSRENNLTYFSWSLLSPGDLMSVSRC